MDTLGQWNAMDNKTLMNIRGGEVNGNLLNSISRILSILLEVGRAIGSSLNRYRTGRSC